MEEGVASFFYMTEASGVLWSPPHWGTDVGWAHLSHDMPHLQGTNHTLVPVEEPVHTRVAKSRNMFSIFQTSIFSEILLPPPHRTPGTDTICIFILITIYL